MTNVNYVSAARGAQGAASKALRVAVSALSMLVWQFATGQPEPEQDLGKGYEPSLAANHISGIQSRLAVCWMDANKQKLEWKLSTNQGQSFPTDPNTIWLGAPATHLDPTLSASDAASGHIYFGFLGAPNLPQAGTSRTLKLDGQFGPDTSMMFGGDRPWLLGVAGTPHVVWPQGSGVGSPAESFRTKRGLEGANGAIAWGAEVTIANASTGLVFGSHGAFARGKAQPGGETQTLVLGALQMNTSNPHAGGTGYYLYRSTDAGSVCSQ